MATTPEGKVKARVDAILSRHTNVIVNPMTMGFGKSGVVDKLTCISGMFIAIETKTVQATGAKRYPTKLQYRFMANVLREGGYVAVINESNVDELERWISHLEPMPNDFNKPLMFDGCQHPFDGEKAATLTSA